MRVDDDAAQIGVGIGAGIEPGPGPVELDEAGLDKILSGMPVAGQQDRYPQVALAVLAHEGSETLVEVARVSPHRSFFQMAWIPYAHTPPVPPYVDCRRR